MPLRAHGAFPRAQRLRLLAPRPPHLGIEHFRRNGRDNAAVISSYRENTYGDRLSDRRGTMRLRPALVVGMWR